MGFLNEANPQTTPLVTLNAGILYEMHCSASGTISMIVSRSRWRMTRCRAGAPRRYRSMSAELTRPSPSSTTPHRTVVHFGDQPRSSTFTKRLASWCPRQDSNLRTRFRKPLLYPLSYEGGTSARNSALSHPLAYGVRRRPRTLHPNSDT